MTKERVKIETSRGILETIILKIKRIVIPCDCDILTKTYLVTFKGRSKCARLYVCKECGKSHLLKEGSELESLYIMKMRNLL